MPFSYPATSLFDELNAERVVWSEQEYDARLAEGWTAERREVAAETPAEPIQAPKRRAKKGE